MAIDVPEDQLHARAHRAKLQLALLKEVDLNHVRLASRLSRVGKKPSGKLLLEFQDGFKDEVDLLVGADGVRSVNTLHLLPLHVSTRTTRLNIFERWSETSRFQTIALGTSAGPLTGLS